MKKLSIIVPVYNTEEYLAVCIESLVSQTLQDIEIILINDGSTDKTESIIEEYKQKYPEIIKTKKIKNSGAAEARNVGLQMAEGEYIGFADSDDYMETTMYEKLYNKAIQDNSEIVVAGYYSKDINAIKRLQIGNMTQYGKNIKENPEIFLYSNPYLWNKIFKKSLIINNDIKFSKGLRIFEDLEFVYKLFIKANRISKVNEPLYYYVAKREGSLTSEFSKKYFDVIPAMKSLNEFAKKEENYEEIKPYIIYTAQRHIYLRCERIISRKELKMKFRYINETFEFLDKEFPRLERHKYIF